MSGAITIGVAGQSTGSRLLLECAWNDVAQLQEILNGFDGALRAQGYEVETGFVGGTFADLRRRADAWLSTSVITVDIDTHDHNALSENDATAIAELADNDALPGSLLYYTPAGCRVVFALDAPCTDIGLAKRAILGAMTLVERALQPLGLFVETDAQTKDVTRWNFGPNSKAKGVQREEDVYILNGVYSVEALAASAPTRDPRNLEPPPGYLAGLVKDSLRFKIDPTEHADCTAPLMTRCADAIARLHIYTEDAFDVYIRPWNEHLKDQAFTEEELRVRFRAAFARFESDKVAETGVGVFAPLELPDEAHAAERFVWYLEQEAPHVFDLGSIWRYESETGVWRELPGHEVQNAIRRYMRAHPCYGRAKVLELSAARIAGIQSIAEAMLAKPGFFDSAPNGVAVMNGFLLVDGAEIQFRERSADWKCRHLVRVAYDPGAKDELLEDDFLGGLFRGAEDAETRLMVLQQFAGAALFGLGPKFQTALVLYGTGSNGKSLFLDALRQLFPPHTTGASSPQEWSEPYQRHSLRNLLLNAPSEIPAKAVLEGSWFKAVVGGDQISARAVGERVTFFQPRATHMFACNTLPPAYDVSEGFWRRFRLIKFENRFEVNPGYSAAVLRKNQAMLTWCVEGARSLLAAGRYGEVDKETVAEWRLGGDPVAQFLVEELERIDENHAGEWMHAKALYGVFTLWLLETRGTKMGRDTFLGRLRELGVGRKITNQGKKYGVRPKLRLVENAGDGGLSI